MKGTRQKEEERESVWVRGGGKQGMELAKLRQVHAQIRHNDSHYYI